MLVYFDDSTESCIFNESINEIIDESLNVISNFLENYYDSYIIQNDIFTLCNIYEKENRRNKYTSYLICNIIC